VVTKHARKASENRYFFTIASNISRNDSSTIGHDGDLKVAVYGGFFAPCGAISQCLR
jgi:hypothetical protein